MNVIALACLLFCQAKPTEAEELFKKVEEKAAAAKSLRWKATATLGEGEKALTFKMTAEFKGTTKVNVQGASTEPPITFGIISDGTKVCGLSSKVGNTTHDAGLDFGAGLNRALIRGGLMTINHPRLDASGKEVADGVAVSGFALGADEKVGGRTVRVLTYEVAVYGKQKISGKLWIDAETHALVKRVLTQPKDPSLTETFEEWTFDPELKDEAFALPKAK